METEENGQGAKDGNDMMKYMAHDQYEDGEEALAGSAD